MGGNLINTLTVYQNSFRLHLKFSLQDRGCCFSRVADSNSEQILQVIFPESEVWLIQIQISFYGNMHYGFATLKNAFYFFPVL